MLSQPQKSQKLAPHESYPPYGMTDVPLVLVADALSVFVASRPPMMKYTVWPDFFKGSSFAVFAIDCQKHKNYICEIRSLDAQFRF